MSKRRPKLLVFDLAYTLWPFWTETHLTPPLRRGKNKKVIDACGRQFHYYDQVPGILERLLQEGYELAVASRTSEIVGVHQLIDLFGWDGYFKYKEIYPGSKVNHFNKIQEASGVKFEDMIFFDDEPKNIQDLTDIGVLSILVKNGVTEDLINDVLDKFANR